MNDDRGSLGEDALEAGPDAPGVSGAAGPADGQAPAASVGGAAGNGQAWPSGAGVGQPSAGGAAGLDVPPGTGEPPEPGEPGAEDGAGATAAPLRRPRRRRRRGKSRSWWIELPILLVLALVLALLIKTFVVQAFWIPSSSMENTLEIGDKVLVNKLVYDFRPIHRGDIVVFNGDGSWNPEPVKSKPPLVRLWDSITGLFGSPPGAHDYIKRVIGVAGDHVVCCDREGRITVNGVPLSEKTYLFPGNPPSSTPFRIVVPPGHLWVMGDHRDVSADSRSHTTDPGHGTIPQDQVVGRAFLIIAPISRWRVLPIPATFEQRRLAAGSAGPAAASAPSAVAGRASPLAGLAALAAEPGAPLAVGLAGAVPLTWLQRRLRRRIWAGARRRPVRPGVGGRRG